MKYRLLYPSTFSTEPIQAALAAESIECFGIHTPRDLAVGTQPTVFILDPPSRLMIPKNDLRRFVDAGGSIVALMPDDEIEVPESVPETLVNAILPAVQRPRHLLVALRSAFRDSAVRTENARLRRETATRTRELTEMTRIGIALSTERDYGALLELILSQARQITSSDAGSLYLVEEGDGEEERHLRFKLAHNDSRPNIPFHEFTIPLDDSSIVGHVATTNDPMVIDDVYFLPPDVQYTFNRSVIDEKFDYRTKSMLTIPMTDHHGRVIGALQLINRKRNFDVKLEHPEIFAAEIIPYSPRTVELASALAGQAAVSIENSKLHDEIKNLFKGFVYSAVDLIERRDPATQGHSRRVAAGTTALAQVVNRVTTGPYAKVSFTRDQLSEIEYASVLHDFGKVGVRESVLVKAKKLHPLGLDLVRQRYQFIHRSVERDYYQQLARYLDEHGKEGYAEFDARLQRRRNEEISALERFFQLVVTSNEPSVLAEGNFDEILSLGERTYEDFDGTQQPFLTGDEVRFLTIRKGSLDEQERLEIESHVSHTYSFLLKIPWTTELQGIPGIAYGHHEKLNGSGYPRNIDGNEIPPQTRMMTIADIFDALTASDRPYKRAVPQQRALNIMDSDVTGGLLDQDLFSLFTEAKVFERMKD